MSMPTLLKVTKKSLGHREIGFDIAYYLCYPDPAFGLQNSHQVI